MNLIRGQIHLLINNGATVADCRDLVRHQVRWWTDEEIARELYDRSRNPQFRSYLWSYPAGMDWFVRLVEAGGTTPTEAPTISTVASAGGDATTSVVRSMGNND
ncbi:MAG: hypothetical protein ACRDQH_04815 [Pseudonocardiaceae bacterium]